MASPLFDAGYALEHRYTRERGRVYLTGVQALVRLPMLQRARDAAAGLETAGFVSGYRGSPLGTYDLALWQARAQLEAHRIRFEPGVNEDLAATAVWGTQQANLHPGAKYDGVFGIWYGKGPGVDRSCDAIKHGNYAGTAPKGGVLALCGDDPGAKSSSIAHQSEHALIHCGIPILNPSSVQEYLDLGLAGFALSRFSGCWVALKCLTDTVDSAASVEVGPERVRLVEPDFARGPGFHIGWANLPIEVERRLYQQRLPAAQAFVRANGLDRVALDAPSRRLGIVTTGKAYLDVREALVALGIDDALARELGLCVYKVAMSWPLEPEGALAFCDGLDDVLVVEEKRVVIEDQLARLLYNRAQRPRLAGKRDARGAALVPAEGELAPGTVAETIRRWLEGAAPGAGARLRPPPEPPAAAPPAQLTRLPAFCSGCPHNTSTVVPEGSVALGGIGCHGMAAWMPERRTLAVTQMGGEGANWIGQAPYTSVPHIFQNMGDGTYFHSGLLAIRAAVAAKVNVTYKLLVNGAVAMTGGQPIEGEPMAGEITCPEIARQLTAEGVARVAVVSVEPEKFPAGSLPAGVTLHHRDELARVQKEMREFQGVSAIVYDQTCAAEARRLRKRGEFPDPERRIVINERVCEGCGDCSVVSNCISIEPVETALGRKRRINQSSCNKDYSCVKGHCPSFVSVLGGRVKKATGEGVAAADALFAGLPPPPVAPCAEPWNVLIAGIGGTGVVTVGAILAMAAHLEGKGCSELDVTGLAQKNGPVSSHVRIAERPDAIFASRIGVGGADLVLGCDLVVATNPENLPRSRRGRSFSVMNRDVAPTADFARNSDLDLSSEGMEAAVRAACGDDAARFVNASQLATVLLGDAIASNMMLLGMAAQLGRLPVSLAALQRAIELNGRQVEMNERALAWGRLLAHDPAAVERVAKPLLRGEAGAALPTTLDEIVAHRSELLTAYQNPRLAERYRALVARVAERERALDPGCDALARAVARSYAKRLAYKDEYEVARLYSDGAFREQVAREFEGDYRLRLHLDSSHVLPFGLAPRDPETGRAKKLNLPAGLILPLFRVMARLKVLRGTPFDVFGWRRHRRFERGLIAEYEATVAELLDGLTAENLPVAVELASLPEHVRGFDSVKERQYEEARQKHAELLAAFRLRTP
jgi:indolepyruvate ferredoxin oxidoreductase